MILQLTVCICYDAHSKSVLGPLVHFLAPRQTSLAFTFCFPHDDQAVIAQGKIDILHVHISYDWRKQNVQAKEVIISQTRKTAITYTYRATKGVGDR